MPFIQFINWKGTCKVVTVVYHSTQSKVMKNFVIFVCLFYFFFNIQIIG